MSESRRRFTPPAWRPVLWVAVLGVALPLAALSFSGHDARAEDSADDVASADIARLVGQLGDDDFRTREAASRALEALGTKARPALEKVLASDAGPEVRWRAEQVLRRLRGGDRERPLGGAAPTPPEAGAETPGAVTPEVSPDFDDALKKLEKLLEEWRSQGSALGSLGGMLGSRRVSAPGLMLDRSLGGRVTLRVQRADSGGAKVEDVYTGHSLEDILANHPDLTQHEGMTELKRREAEADWPGLEDFRKQFERFGRVAPLPRGGLSVVQGTGIEIRHDADGVLVRLRERGEDGEETVKEFRGKTLDDIKAEHPELADKLGGFQVFVGPPQVFWPGARQGRLQPLVPAPTTPRARGQSYFGLTLVDVPEVLASHLGLEKGQGALVDNVLPGSQAEAFGVERNDVLVAVQGQAVGVTEAADLLRKAGMDKAPVRVELIRRGARQTLER